MVKTIWLSKKAVNSENIFIRGVIIFSNIFRKHLYPGEGDRDIDKTC